MDVVDEPLPWIWNAEAVQKWISGAEDWGARALEDAFKHVVDNIDTLSCKLRSSIVNTSSYCSEERYVHATAVKTLLRPAFRTSITALDEQLDGVLQAAASDYAALVGDRAVEEDWPALKDVSKVSAAGSKLVLIIAAVAAIDVKDYATQKANIRSVLADEQGLLPGALREHMKAILATPAPTFGSMGPKRKVAR
jgi:hypothetical protein